MRFLPQLLLGFLILFVHQLWAQSEETARAIVEQRIEELTELSEQDYDYTELFEHFSYLYQNPIYINSATEDDLRKLMFLNESQIAVILFTRNNYGYFRSIYELKDLDGFYIELLLQIQPFISFEIVEKPKGMQLTKSFKYAHSDLLVRYGSVLEDQAGYDTVANPNNHYMGSKAKLYFRYKYSYQDRLSIGINGEKDAGEEFFKGSNPYGFDFYSMHLFVRSDKLINKLAIGDYHLEFGQGLTLWSSLGFSKSATTINTQRQGRGLRPNSSANEYLFYRGAAATLTLTKSLELTPFYSTRLLDASTTISDSIDAEEYYIQSIQETGLHRTQAEIAKEKLIKEQIFGANINYKISGFKVGLTSYYSTYDKNTDKSNESYKLYDFTEKTNVNTGLDFSYANRYFSAYGEAAYSKNGGQAYLAGMYFNLHARLNLNVVYRNYFANYQNRYTMAFGESSKNQNEEGVYLGVNINTGPMSNIVVYYDIYKFDWLKYRVNRPSYGHEFSVQYLRTPNSKYNYYLRYQYEEKMINQSNTTSAYIPVGLQSKHSGRFNISANLGSGWKLQSRLSVSAYNNASSEWFFGYLLFSDLEYRFTQWPLALSMRYAVVNTDSYDARIYAYEKDVLYKFSVPAYYEKGQRYYFLVQYAVNSKLSFWMRFSQSVFSQLNPIGSGLDEIQGNHKSEITLQMRLKI